ncbi:hypothetical protein QR680_004396 [Steinernema hermaphroditum]|uniref:RNA helicase n=1 Tax=Steinernema hermaphroditum TaxID=289476 RepID=A0AA39HNL1_9BILA|nr:hypothetical protein QR680_004396 [Steinernema hermaphroditum]
MTTKFGSGRGGGFGGRRGFGGPPHDDGESQSGGFIIRGRRGGGSGGRGGFGAGNNEVGAGSSFGRGGGRGGGFGGGRGGGYGSGADNRQSDGGFVTRGGRGGGFGGRGGFGVGKNEEGTGSLFGRGGGRGEGFGGSRAGCYGGGADSTQGDNSFGERGGRGGGFGSHDSIGAGNNEEGTNTGSSLGRGGGRGGGFGGSRGGADNTQGDGGFGTRDSFGTGNNEKGADTGSSFGCGSDRGNFGGNQDRAENNEAGPEFEEDDETNTSPPPSTYVPAIKEVDELFKEDQQSTIYSGTDEDVIVEGIDESKVVFYNKWSDCNFNEKLYDNVVNRCKCARPIKIQAGVIPLITSGYDVMGHVQTGGGKTAAFLLPIMQKIIDRPAAGVTARCSPVAIVIGPTREVVLQLADQGKTFSDGTPVSIAKAYGEYNVRENLKEIRNGCDILCATPGRLKQLVNNKEIGFDNLSYLILDEADQLLENDFLADIVEIIRFEGFPDVENRQTLIFSATISHEVQEFANQILRRAKRVMVSTKKTTDHPSSRVIQKFVSVPKFDKIKRIKGILKKELDASKEQMAKAGENPENAHIRRTLVFTTQQRTTDLIAGYLSSQGIRASSINRDSSQNLREKALRDFREGQCYVLVATDACAQGIDIHDLEHVVNYDLPEDATTYVHRITRTGRLSEGTATSFVDPESDSSDLVKEIVDTVRGPQQEIPQFLIGMLERTQSMASIFSEAGPTVEEVNASSGW